MWGTRLFSTVVTALILLRALTSGTTAAEILVGEKGALLIIGRIEVGDDEKFRRTVVAEIKRRGSDDPVGVLLVYSPGGDLHTAMKIGEQVHLLQLTTGAPTLAPPQMNFSTGKADAQIPSSDGRFCDLPGERERRKLVSNEHTRHLDATQEAWKKGNYAPRPFKGQFETFDPKTQRGDARCECASACFFIWAAGAIRAGNVVGVHRPSYNTAEFSKMSPSEARAKYDWLIEASSSYLSKIGLSQALINRVFAVDSTKISYLNQQELAKLYRAPHFEELLIANCGTLTTAQELVAILQKKDAKHPMWKAEADRYVGRVECELTSTQQIHSQTNLEYLKVYDKAVHSPLQPTVVSDGQAQAEAKKVLVRVLKSSGIKGYFVQPGKEFPELKHVHAVWSMRDEAVLGTLLILGPEREMGVEQAAAWVTDALSKSCGGRFVQSPLRPIQGGARMTTVCEHEGIREADHYTFISRKEGGLYLFRTLPVVDSEAAGNAHDKLSEAAIRILGPQSGQ